MALLRERFGAAVDARLYAECEPETQCVDLVNHRARVAGPAHNLQHRAEDFLFYVGNRIHFKYVRADGVAGLVNVTDCRSGCAATQLGRHRSRHSRSYMRRQSLDACLDARKRLAVDQRPHIGGEERRVAHRQLVHRAMQHFDNVVCDFFVHTQQPQRRAALSGRAKRRLHDGIDNVLGQGSAVNEHGVDAARFCDQRHDGAVFVGEAALNDLRDLRGAGEHHARDARMRNERCADSFAEADHTVQRVARNARCVQQLDRFKRDDGRLLGGLCDDRVACDERRCHLARKDR